MRSTPVSTLFRAMAREEWRLHSRLYGGGRFGAFPIMITVAVAGAVWVLQTVDVDVATILAGMHVLVYLFGLHTGSIGFIGRDAMRNLVGDVTLVVFSARTLPVRQRTVLAVFLAKDLAYYGGLFLAPMAIGSTPAFLAANGGAPGLILEMCWLWVTLAWTFVLGLLTTIALIGVLARGIRQAVVGTGLLVAGALVWWFDLDVLGHTPLGVHAQPDIGGLLAGIGVTLTLLAVAIVTFDPGATPTRRTHRGQFRRWMARIGDPIATRTLLEVHRGAGGLSKLFVSGFILLGVTAVLIEFATTVTEVQLSIGLAFGSVLGLAGFTTFNWITMADDPGSYLAQPIDLAGVVGGKHRAFTIAAPAVGGGGYAIAVVAYGASLRSAVVGGVVMLGVTWYTLGLTVYLAGLWPNEFLYDTTRFVGLWLGVGIVLIPLLVVAFAFAPLDGWELAAVAAAGGVLVAIGYGLLTVSGPRWDDRYRSGTVPDS